MRHADRFHLDTPEESLEAVLFDESGERLITLYVSDPDETAGITGLKPSDLRRLADWAEGK